MQLNDKFNQTEVPTATAAAAANNCPLSYGRIQLQRVAEKESCQDLKKERKIFKCVANGEIMAISLYVCMCMSLEVEVQENREIVESVVIVTKETCCLPPATDTFSSCLTTFSSSSTFYLRYLKLSNSSNDNNHHQDDDAENKEADTTLLISSSAFSSLEALSVLC